jgi:hypothetical protein
MWYDDVIGVNHFDNSAIRQFTSVNMQYGNNGITSKKNGYAEIITADFYRRNAETVINSRKSIVATTTAEATIVAAAATVMITS